MSAETTFFLTKQRKSFEDIENFIVGLSSILKRKPAKNLEEKNRKMSEPPCKAIPAIT